MQASPKFTARITTSTKGLAGGPLSDPFLFTHGKLKVYQRALDFFSLADEMAARWDVKHAITDHFPRAAESIVLNLAEASAAVSGVKQKSLDVALGSTLECAACLDIAQVKELIDREALALHKPSLARIFRMQMGLRKSWSGNVVRKEPEAYGLDVKAGQSVVCFQAWFRNNSFWVTDHANLPLLRALSLS